MNDTTVWNTVVDPVLPRGIRIAKRYAGETRTMLDPATPPAPARKDESTADHFSSYAPVPALAQSSGSNIASTVAATRALGMRPGIAEAIPSPRVRPRGVALVECGVKRASGVTVGNHARGHNNNNAQVA